MISGSVSVSDTTAWSDELPAGATAPAGFKGAVPVVSCGKVVLSSDAGHAYIRNGAATTAKTWGFNAPAAVPPNSSMMCLVSAMRSAIIVPYVLHGAFTLASGSQVERQHRRHLQRLQLPRPERDPDHLRSAPSGSTTISRPLTPMPSISGAVTLASDRRRSLLLGRCGDRRDWPPAGARDVIVAPTCAWTHPHSPPTSRRAGAGWPHRARRRAAENLAQGARPEPGGAGRSVRPPATGGIDRLDQARRDRQGGAVPHRAPPGHHLRRRRRAPGADAGGAGRRGARRAAVVAAAGRAGTERALRDPAACRTGRRAGGRQRSAARHRRLARQFGGQAQAPDGAQVVAVFGLPQAYRSDAERAMRCAIELGRRAGGARRARHGAAAGALG